MATVKPRRESLIALRARHQAFRIAADIAYPHVEVAPPPEPAIPLEQRVDYLPRIRSRWLLYRSFMFWVLVATAVGTAFLVWGALQNYCNRYGPMFGL